MHFSIPDTQEFNDNNGSPYTAFNLHINGVFHCAVRFKQLHNFNEQLKKEFGANALPPFPPKKLLSLTPAQLEDRRFMLERYVQIVSQDPQISTCDIFKGFLLNAQQETQRQEPEDVSLDVFLMNGHKITVNIESTDQTDVVLEKVASQIELADDFVYYFGLFLVRKETGGDNSIVRKLQDFESPYISLKAACTEGTHRIVLRKSFWDPSLEDDLMDNRITMNLLYVQAVSDIERGWVHATKDQLKQLAALQQKGSKREYLQFARTLKYYGYIQFKTCTTDYPHPDCRVIVAAGNKELNFRVQVAAQEIKEGSFKVTRMRCWRITTSYPETNGQPDINRSKDGKLELAFEYLVAKDTLNWIKITSDQAILISMCLQGMVDELLQKKQGKKIRKPQERPKKPTSHNYIKRDSSSNFLRQLSGTGSGDGDDTPSAAQKAKESVKKIQDKITTAVKLPLRSPGNDAYDDGMGDNGIGDDDL